MPILFATGYPTKSGRGKIVPANVLPPDEIPDEKYPFVLSTGRVLSLRLVNFLRIEDGRIVEFREFSDTFDVVEQAVGAFLNVPEIVA